ncbi:hypothetical protein [Isoptericola sp. AK164]|uniref:hypothetical protein n=1 Tax=Isoptericola sp. AK164 TaxID=3024246 RepID=UPI002418A731|nr:hypothetical protein [Isoptericola sp. AK164]
MSLVTNPDDAVVHAPTLPRSNDPRRDPWAPRQDARLVVSVLLHAPAYQDVVPAGTTTPQSMPGGVGRDTSEPRHGQVARLSQWDFGLTVGVWRLLDAAADAGVPVAVALDERGVRRMPGLGRLVGERAAEVVARGRAANVLTPPDADLAAETAAVRASVDAVAAATGREVTGWFSPERAETPRTTRALRDAGLRWFGDWPVDERPVALDGDATGLTALPFSLETEDVFALYTRGVTADAYERILHATIDQLLADADVLGPRFLGLSWFGWVLGQACFADVAERVLRRLAAEPGVVVVPPGDVAP